MSTHMDLVEVGHDLEAAVESALSALERAGVSAKDADQFIRDSVFNAWWNWEYDSTVSNQENRPDS